MIIWGFDLSNGKEPTNWMLKKVYADAHSDAINYIRVYQHP